MALSGTSLQQFQCQLLEIDVDCPDVNLGEKLVRSSRSFFVIESLTVLTKIICLISHGSAR